MLTTFNYIYSLRYIISSIDLRFVKTIPLHSVFNPAAVMICRRVRLAAEPTIKSFTEHDLEMAQTAPWRQREHGMTTSMNMTLDTVMDMDIDRHQDMDMHSGTDMHT